MNLQICIITSWFPNKIKPEIAPFNYYFAKELHNEGFDISVITPSVKGDSGDIFTDGLKIYRINKHFPILQLNQIISKIKPHILHIQAPNYFSSQCLMIGKLKRIPTIATVHRAEIDSTNIITSLIRRMILSNLDHIVAVSNFGKNLAIKAGANNNKISVIYNSCDESLFMPRSKETYRQLCNLPSNKKIILFVGNLIKIKGIFTFIESFRKLKSNDFTAIVIGKGKDEEKVKELIQHYNLTTKIQLIGWIKPSDLPYYYNSADVFVLPSFIEGHSVAILEAMASGIPIIACNVGGNPECIENSINGFLIPKDNAEILSEKIEEILSDVYKAERFSQKNIELYKKKFNRKKQIKAYIDLYQKLIVKRK